MSYRNTDSRWGWVAQGFHWLMFLLILGAWIAFELHDDAPKKSPESLQWILLHKSLGLTVFFLVWLRLAWRFANPVPKALIVSPWQAKIATLTHWGLYAVMILLPLSGVLMTLFGGRPLAWFGVFEVPIHLEQNKPLSHQFHDLHTDVFWPLLMVLLALHIGAALWHHFVVKDATLKRMLPGAKL